MGNIVAGAWRWVLEVPLACTLILVYHMGLAGAFWSTAAGYAGAAAGMVLVVWKTDWEQAAQDVMAQVWRVLL